ncbi:MAG: alpha-E domain-containing protein [Acidimicrobiales bacterium]
MYQLTSSPLLLSRVAESAYWAGRYLERAEGTARLIRSHSDLIIDLPRSATLGWRPLLAVLGLEAEDESVLTPGEFTATEERVVALLAADPEMSSSVVASIGAVHRNLRLTRAVMPIEAAEVLTELHGFVSETAGRAVDRKTRSGWLSAVIRQCQTLTGILADTMSHDDAYSFFTIGRQLERADLTSRVLDVQANVLTHRCGDALEPYLDISWFAALRSVSALQAFRRSGLPATPEAKVSFLLRDPKCPRTVESCLVETARWLLEIPGHGEPMARCASTQGLLEQADPATLVASGLHDFTDDLQLAIGQIHQSIAASWFKPVSTTKV